MNKPKISIISILSVMIIMMIGCDSTTQSPTANADENPTLEKVQMAHSSSGSIVYVDANADDASEDGSQANPYNEIQEGIDHAGSGETVKLLSDFTLSSQVTINNSLTLDGSGNTIYASFDRDGDYSNNAAIGIDGANDVTVSNLVIDGADGDKLHGINVYVSTGVLVSDVSIKDNDHTGLVVNGSEVTAHNISTSGHSWHAMNVDLGSGVDGPARLTVTGTSSHTETYPPTPHIYIDDISKDVSVDDVEGQYNSEEFANPQDETATARAYFLVSIPETKDDCKDGGYADYGFKNQGQCIQFVKTGNR